jgi:hypothetical protein
MKSKEKHFDFIHQMNLLMIKYQLGMEAFENNKKEK